MQLILARLLSLLYGVISLTHGAHRESSPHFCLVQEEDSKCTGKDCTRTIQLPCDHGVCTDTGKCDCLACWEGPSCNVTSNKHAPVFNQSFYEEYISPDEPTDYPFMYVRATDDDEAHCPLKTHCPCSEVLYSLEDEENGAKSPLFIIDSKTGAISVATGADLEPNSKHTLMAYARNRDNRQIHGTVQIVVIVSDVYLKGQSVKLRRLLVAPESLSLLDTNKSIDISFLPTEADTTIGVLTVGSRVNCELTIDIPEAMLVQDIHVEIFTKDANNTLSVLCEPSLSLGSEIEISNSVKPEIAYDHEEGSPFLADTAIFNLGNVSNMNTSTSDTASKVVITFSITLKEAITSENNTWYWVTAGVEYNGETKLWIGQIGFQVELVPEYTPDTNITLYTPSDFYKGEVEVFELELNVYRSVANLTVKATAGSTTYLLICKLQLCHTGSGYCLDVTKDLAAFQVDVASQNIYAYTYGFGNIINGGVANSTVDSRISMDVVGYLRDDVALAAESPETIDIFFDDGMKQSTDTGSFTVKAARASFMTPGKTLEMNVTIIEGDDQLMPGESVKIRVAISIPYSSSIKPVNVTLTPMVQGDEFQLCAVQINHIGNDISCLEQLREAIEGAVIYSVGPVATIDLGGVANTGGLSSENGIDNVIGIDFFVKSAVTDPLQHGNTHTLQVTVEHADKPPVTNTIVVTVITDPAAISYPSVPLIDSTPFTSAVDLLNPTNSAEVSPGAFAILAVKPIIKADSQYKYDVAALVNSTGLTILLMRVTSVGSNIACGLLDSDPVANYTSFSGSSNNDIAELDLGLVNNFARSGTPPSDDDALTIEIIILIKEDTAEMDHPIVVSVMVGSSRIWVAEGNLTVSASAAMDPVLPTNSTLFMAPTYSHEVVPSLVETDTKILHTIVLPGNSSLRYVINYTTTVPWLKVTNINVTSVGEQLLCSQTGPLIFDNGTLSSGMFATVDLGYVCNVPLGYVNTNNSELVIELTVTSFNTTDLEIGEQGVVSANLQVSSNGLTLNETTEIILTIAPPKSSFKLCCPTTANLMRPQEIQHCNVTMTILDIGLRFILEINTPFNVTATLTINKVEVDTSGSRNIQVNVPTTVLSSSGNTTQNDKAVLDFGRIINTETYTAEAGTLLASDNDIVIHLDVQMAGGEQNVNGTEHSLNAGVEMGSGDMIWVAYWKLTTEGEGPDKPALNVSFGHNNSVPTIALGEKVWYNVDLSHYITSRAEATNVSGHIFLPPYIQFDSMVPDYSLSSKQPEMTTFFNNTGFYFEIPMLFFTDHVVFNIETTLRLAYLYKLTKIWKGTTPIEVVFNMQYRDLSDYAEGFYFSEPMSYVTFDFIVPYPYIPGTTVPPSCPSPIPLGMESGTIEDCQITASFSPDANASAHHARLNGGSAWKTQARAGPFIYDRWLKVDLGKKSALTGVRTQGGGSAGANGDLGKFEILYSLDDTLYIAATPESNTVFNHQKDPPANHHVIVNHVLYMPVEVRYVVLNLTGYDYNSVSKWYNAIRIELLGCEIDTVKASDVCPSSIPPLDEEYERGFLVDTITQTVFVCDVITHGKSGIRKELQSSVYAIQWKKPDMQCFMMKYADKQWVGLDTRLRNIIGFLPSTNRLYGIMSNSPGSYAASDSPHSSWYLIPKSEYDEAAASDGFVRAVAVPFISTTNFEFSAPNDYNESEYAFSEWKATMSGIYKGNEKVLDWNSCCQATCTATGGEEDCT